MRSVAVSPPSGAKTLPWNWGAASRWLRILVLAAPLAVLFAGTFRTLWSVWSENPNYSHGVLVVPISLILLWTRRKSLRGISSIPSRLGLPLLALGVVTHLMGLRGDVTILEGYGFLMVLAGLVLHLGGWTWLRVLGFPLAFLVFMLPWPPFLMNQVSFGLKTLASQVSGAVLDQLGIPVVRQGAVLYLAPGPLAVENPCSGLRSLLALLALGTLMARMGSVPLWKRAALLAAAWPVAFAANVGRIVALGLVATFHSLELAVGTAHDISGYALFALALLMLEVFRRVLRW